MLNAQHCETAALRACFLAKREGEKTEDAAPSTRRKKSFEKRVHLAEMDGGIVEIELCKRPIERFEACREAENARESGSSFQTRPPRTCVAELTRHVKCVETTLENATKMSRNYPFSSSEPCPDRCFESRASAERCFFRANLNLLTSAGIDAPSSDFQRESQRLFKGEAELSGRDREARERNRDRWEDRVKVNQL